MGCIGIAARAALPVAIALLLGAVPQQARAGACQDAGLVSGCVTSSDIARNSLRAVDIKVESQGFFSLGNNAFNIPRRSKPYAQVTLTPPSDGWLIINASANIGAGTSTNDIEAKASIVCRFKIGRRFSTARVISGSLFRAAVSRRNRPSVSIAWLSRRKVEGGKSRTIFLSCGRLDGTDLSISKPAITVVFHPVKY